jgi:nitroimidazol reductase NimA-like FMN-containing flavoprotein (pyridoxamine 5'-phosphate oxidase superfamily)
MTGEGHRGIFMKNIKRSRPHLPEGYIQDPGELLTWDFVEEKLTEAVHYWLCTVYPDGRPHVVPKWAVLVEGKIYFDGSPETRHAKNIAENPSLAIHLESGADAVIGEGKASAINNPPLDLREKVAKAYTKKYADLGYSPTPEMWEKGVLYEIRLAKALAWTAFMKNTTKFKFE